MISIPKVGILTCSFLLCLGLSNAARSEHAPSPSDVMKTDSVSDRKGFQSDDDKQKNVDNKKDSPRETMLKGELMRVENANYFVKMAGGKEVRIHTDKTTEIMGTVKKGDQIEAKVNDKHHALSIRSAQ